MLTAGAAVAEPHDVFPTWHARILQRDLLQGIDRLRNPLPVEGTVHLLEGQRGRQMIQCVQKVRLVSCVALQHLQRFISDHHQFRRRVQLRRLCRQKLAHRIADKRKVIKARIQAIEHEDGHRSLSIRVIISGIRTHHVRLWRFE